MGRSDACRGRSVVGCRSTSTGSLEIVRADRFDVNESDAGALFLGCFRAIAAHDPEFSRLVIYRDEPVPLLDGQGGGHWDAQSNMLHLPVGKSRMGEMTRRESGRV